VRGKVVPALAVRPQRIIGTQIYGRAGDPERRVRRQQVRFDERHVSRLSPLGWDHINLTRDYVWTENVTLDVDGMRPLKLAGLNGGSVPGLPYICVPIMRRGVVDSSPRSLAGWHDG
jgi:hypothetical protein